METKIQIAKIETKPGVGKNKKPYVRYEISDLEGNIYSIFQHKDNEQQLKSIRKDMELILDVQPSTIQGRFDIKSLLSQSLVPTSICANPTQPPQAGEDYTGRTTDEPAKAAMPSILSLTG